MNSQEFRGILEGECGGWDADTRQKVVRFYEVVCLENERQNLTRLIEPRAFFERHVLDVKALVEWGKVGGRALDLGSGLGVPGLLAAVVGGSSWVLAESEGRKSEFLRTVAQELGVLGVSVDVFGGRGEEFLKKESVEAVIARAVGSVSRIYSWIGKCSTWNKLILFKGPKWDEEWKEFLQSKFRRELEIEDEFLYEVGAEKKKLRLVQLDRVLRGTKKE